MADHGERRVTQTEQRPPEGDPDSSSRGSPLVHQHTEVSFSGPLPPPGVLEGYERVLPGSAERIFTMAEKQFEHRLHLEKVVIEGGAKRANMGIYAAVIVEGMFLATSCYLAHLGLTADALGFGTLSRRSERIKKKQRQTQDEPGE